jgi:UDP-glucose 4-epimerase
MKEPRKNLDVNVIGVLNILEALKECRSEASFVHVGTTTQFGSLIYEPADENHPESPTDIYSANKVAGEKYVLLYSNSYDLNTCVVRLPNTFGPRAAIHSSNFTFNNYFIGLALQGKDITVFKPGEQLRNVIYVEDAVAALILAAESTQSSKGETFLAVSDDHYTVRELAIKTCSSMGGKLNLIDWPKNLKNIEIGNARFSNKKIKSVLGWTPKIKLAEGLELTKNYFSDCLEHYFNDE